MRLLLLLCARFFACSWEVFDSISAMVLRMRSCDGAWVASGVRPIKKPRKLRAVETLVNVSFLRSPSSKLSDGVARERQKRKVALVMVLL